MTVLVLACSVLAGRVGLAPAWGILPAFFPGPTMGLARDLAEPLNACLLTLAIFACTSASFGWAALALAAAALTRETTMISVAAVALAHQFDNPLPELRRADFSPIGEQCTRKRINFSIAHPPSAFWPSARS